MNESNFPIVYLCDFEKNKKCKKDLCQTDCFFTLNKKFSKDRKEYFFDVNHCEFRCLDSGQ